MKTPELAIRPFDKATDIENLSSIWLDASLLAHPFIGKVRLIEQRKLIAEKYLPDAETWVACQAGAPVGFISLIDTFIGGLFVAPSQQKRGVGRMLVAHALERKEKLSLEVYTQNRQAVRFYTALGFREVSRRPFDDQGLPFENAHLEIKA